MYVNFIYSVPTCDHNLNTCRVEIWKKASLWEEVPKSDSDSVDSYLNDDI